MDSSKVLYHGSISIIEKPEYGKGSKFNDYGSGFYCTEDIELAKEWACGSKSGGFVNVYSLDTRDLRTLNLSQPQYNLIDWLTVLINNRIFSITSPIAADAKEYLTKSFLPDISQADVITGYRADDSYFTFALDFLNNAISLRQLNKAMRLGALGEQVVLKSRKAFDTVMFQHSDVVPGDVYYAKRKKRDTEAREQYLKRERISGTSGAELYMIDILREEMKPGDERLQGDLFK